MRVYSQEIASTVNGELNKIKESINVADYSLSGIDDDGSLLVREDSGEVLRLLSGNVSVRYAD